MNQRRGHVLVAVGLGLLALVGLLGALGAAEAGLHASATDDVAEGLVLHYKFDFDDGSDIVWDYAGMDDYGLLNGAVYTSTTPPLWVPNVNAIDFDGVDDYIEVPSITDTLSDRSFSVAFWARRDITGTGHIAVSQGDPSVNHGLHIGFRDSNHFTFTFWGYDLDTTTVYTDSDWHHWACTYDADSPERIIYYDGTAVAADEPLSDYLGSGPLIIGNQLDLTNPFDGLIDEVRVYTRTLGAPEVAELAFKTDTEADTLMALYYSTTGISWTVSTDWGTDSSYCDWYGIACIGEGVSLIALGSNNLSGTIPSALGTLGSLQYLYLYDNSLTGTIPSALGTLGSLQYLYLYDNSLTGTIPSELGELSALQYLYLFGNSLTGTIPSALGTLGSLEILDLGINNLTGSIPPELGELSSLRDLLLDSNDLGGAIPAELGDLSSLALLWLNSNNLTGTIPPELAELSHLQQLLLYDNDLGGPIPWELANLSNLAYLNLDSNPLLTCWETEAALDWALTLTYGGPTEVCPSICLPLVLK